MLSNLPPGAPFRGPGGPPMSFALEQAVDDIIHEVETGGREVTSAQIGTHVMAKLRDIDEVAYLRFTSVHRRFEQADEFVDAIQALGRRVKTNAQQRELFPAEKR